MITMTVLPPPIIRWYDKISPGSDGVKETDEEIFAKQKDEFNRSIQYFSKQDHDEIVKACALFCVQLYRKLISIEAEPTGSELYVIASIRRMLQGDDTPLKMIIVKRRAGDIDDGR